MTIAFWSAQAGSVSLSGTQATVVRTRRSGRNHFFGHARQVRAWPIYAPAKSAFPPSLAVIELDERRPWRSTVRKNNPHPITRKRCGAWSSTSLDLVTDLPTTWLSIPAHRHPGLQDTSTRPHQALPASTEYREAELQVIHVVSEFSEVGH